MPAGTALAVVVVLAIVLAAAYYLRQRYRADPRTVPVAGRAYGGAPSMVYLPSFAACAQACTKNPACVGCGFYASLPKGDGANYSCYLYAESDAKAPSFWRGPAVAAGDALSRSLLG